MKHFSDRLVAAVKAKKSPVCVGLDPRIEKMPPGLYKEMIDKFGDGPKAVAETFIAFNKGIIDAVHDLVPVVKPQFAFYINHGFEGVRAFAETCSYAKSKGLLVIADAKANDIGSTAEAYAEAFLGPKTKTGDKPAAAFECDALTVNAYLGYDGVKPFMDVCKKNGAGIFVLVRTSNPSSNDLQARQVDGAFSVSDLMAHFVDSWGSDEVGESGFSSIGAVVGATHKADAAKLRELMPNALFLVPGYGAQGGSAEDVAVCFTKDHQGAIINSSRDIIFAYEKLGLLPDQFADAARGAVQKMNLDLAQVL